MSEAATAPAAVALRPPEQVMRLDRMGAAHPTRLSFLRVLLRRARAERWRVRRVAWALDAQGYGHAVTSVDMPSGTVSLVAFSTPLAPENRTDRVIAEAWDTAYGLYDGVPDAAEIARLAATAPRQEAARYTPRDLVLSRANRSVRLFDLVTRTLAEGRQPAAAEIDAVGYLMRTTAVYGNGKFGIADRAAVLRHPALAGPFAAEMLTVWLIRAFTLDLADHVAQGMAPGRAVALAPELRRRIGVGNATGLGMAPFLVRHPVLLHRWIAARETALARVRALPASQADAWPALLRLARAAPDDVAGWHTDDAVQTARIATLRADLATLARHLDAHGPDGALPFDAVWRFAEAELGTEAQEYTLSLLLEPHGAVIDDLAATMGADERDGTAIDGHMGCGALAALIAAQYGWALALDFADPAAQARFWYVSAGKLEPRLGERAEEPGAEREQPLAVGREIAALHRLLLTRPAGEPVATLLLARPEFRHVARRAQLAARYPYAEIRDNLLDAAMRPIDLLRCKLAFFGARRFDPRSDRWLRITLFAGAPLPDAFA